jgi:hypothetical protein
MDHGCSMVTAAIDALAHLITGQPHYYSIDGSVPPRQTSGGSGQKPGV